jgi:hypothetical protein
VIGRVAGRPPFRVHKLVGMRFHTRTIIRDRHHAFVGSQSLRTAELEWRRELGLIVQDAKAVKTLVETFESDWTSTDVKEGPVPPKGSKASFDELAAVSQEEAEKAVQVLTKELDPLATMVKETVRKAVVTAGEGLLHDKNVKDTMKKVVKKVVKKAVKEVVEETEEPSADSGGISSVAPGSILQDADADDQWTLSIELLADYGHDGRRHASPVEWSAPAQASTMSYPDAILPRTGDSADRRTGGFRDDWSGT